MEVIECVRSKQVIICLPWFKITHLSPCSIKNEPSGPKTSQDWLGFVVVEAVVLYPQLVVNNPHPSLFFFLFRTHQNQGGGTSRPHGCRTEVWRRHLCPQHRGSLTGSDSPGDAVRGGSVYLPRREQVHGHRSVESAAPGEAQPAASLRHGAGCGWDSPIPSWVRGRGGGGSADQGGSSSVFGVWVRVREVERRHAHGEAERTSGVEVMSPSRLEMRGGGVGWGGGPSEPLGRAEPQWEVAQEPTERPRSWVVPTAPLRRCEGWGERRCRTGAPREAAPGNAGAAAPRCCFWLVVFFKTVFNFDFKSRVTTSKQTKNKHVIKYLPM